MHIERTYNFHMTSYAVSLIRGSTRDFRKYFGQPAIVIIPFKIGLNIFHEKDCLKNMIFLEV